jgi:hypothetical protein
MQVMILIGDRLPELGMTNGALFAGGVVPCTYIKEESCLSVVADKTGSSWAVLSVSGYKTAGSRAY